MVRGVKGEDGERPMLFKEHQVALQQELQLTELQLHNIRRFYASDRKHEYLATLPPTIVVHKKLAMEKLEIRQCVYITGFDAARLKVFAAPRFCCRRQPDRAAACPPYSGFVNIERRDLDVIATTNKKPTNPTNINLDKAHCMQCFTPFDITLERSAFSLGCGHFSCRSCWLEHARWALWRQFAPIPCMNGHCNQQLTIGGASAIFDAATIGIMRENQWRTKLLQKDNVRCAGCSKWLERTNFHRRGLAFGCGACGCFTCTRCAKIEHSPLSCSDAQLWREIRKDQNAPTRAQEELSLDEEVFEQCLSPQRFIDSREWADNIGHIKAYNKRIGRGIERDMRMVAALLEMRTVQQLAGLKCMQLTPEITYHRYDDANWAGLERYFYEILERNCYHRESVYILRRYREYVVYF